MKAFKILPFALAFQMLCAQNEKGSISEKAEYHRDHHDHVVVVLDASGSMKQRMRARGSRISKMDAAKKALKAVLSHVPQTTHIGLLVFSSRNLKDHWAYPLGPRDERRLIEAIEKPIASRGTPLGEYIKIGADRLLKARNAQYGYGTYRLLIVTDGEASDAERVDLYTPEVLARGIIVDVIGVDMSRDHTLAKMAHSYRRANDPASLEEAIREVFAELSNDADGFSMEDAFEILAPFPSESAAAAIEALSVLSNDPIGEGISKRSRSRSSNSNSSRSNSRSQFSNSQFSQSSNSNSRSGSSGSLQYETRVIHVEKRFEDNEKGVFAPNTASSSSSENDKKRTTFMIILCIIVAILVVFSKKPAHQFKVILVRVGVIVFVTFIMLVLQKLFS